MNDNPDMEIVDRLLAHDENVTHKFFHVMCHNLFACIIRQVYDTPVEEDEFINELYIYLMENDGARLRQYEGKSTLRQWLKVVAMRYFIKKRDHIVEDVSHEPEKPVSNEPIADADDGQARADLERLFAMMKNERYVFVIRRSILDGAEPETIADELNVTMGNYYNIKKRALTALTEIATKDKENYG